MLNADDIADIYGEFTWDFGECFFVETAIGNFIWSDPDYGGDNKLTPYNGTIKDFFKNGSFGRDKGSHMIGNYCGNFIYNIDFLYEKCKEILDEDKS